MNLLLLLRNSQIVELSHLYEENMPVWPSHPKFIRATAESYAAGDGNYNNQLLMGDHCGTHVDSPAHFIPDGKTIEEIDVRQLLGRGICIDVSSTPAAAEFGISEMQAWEESHGEIAAGDIVIFRTGYHNKWRLRPDHAPFLADWPGLSAAGACWLGEKKVKVVGTDAMSMDAWSNHHYPVHQALLGSDSLIIENLANLDRLPPIFTFIALPLRIAGGSASPVRAIALVE